VVHKRVLRVGEALRRELGFILDREVGDPRIGMVTITRVELSDDLRYAKLFVSFLGDRDEREEALRHLRKARKFLRSQLASRLDLRIVPELTFVLDDSSEQYLRIAEVLKQIEDEHEERDDDDPGEDPHGS
jgi:ribosome-binding factor A